MGQRNIAYQFSGICENIGLDNDLSMLKSVWFLQRDAIAQSAYITIKNYKIPITKKVQLGTGYTAMFFRYYSIEGKFRHINWR